MTNKTWTNAGGGNWAFAPDWSTQSVPGAGDTANLTNTFGGNAYDVDVTDSESASVVNISAANAALEVGTGGVLSAGTINLNAGMLLVDGGEVDGATIVAGAGASYDVLAGTLADTTWRGPLVLSNIINSDHPTVTGGLTLLNASGTGSGELDVSSPGGEIDFSTLTLDGQAGDAGLQINITSLSNPSVDLGILQNATLTIGSHAHVNLGGISDVGIINASTGGALVNDGTITTDSPRAEISLASFTNAGTLNVDDDLGFPNLLDIAGPLSGTGAINLSSGATLELGGAASGSTIHFIGEGGTLQLDSPSSFGEIISGLTAGDGIDLAGTSVESAVVNGSTLLVTEANSTVLTYQLGSANPAIHFAITAGGTTASGAAGSDLTVSNTKNNFNGDQTSDILWQNSNTGQVLIYEMNGTQVIGPGSVGGGGGWNVIATGDFNNDGATDILWQNSNTGAVLMYEMNGTQVNGSAVIGGGGGWNVVGTADFNGDGKTDICGRTAIPARC
jgi:hypothetical protein